METINDIPYSEETQNLFTFLCLEKKKYNYGELNYDLQNEFNKLKIKHNNEYKIMKEYLRGK